MSTDIYTTKNHYVYQITNTKNNKKYIGKRSTYLNPEDDIGFKYFSSSSDKNFIKDQKENNSDYIYEVLSIHDNAKEAIDEEIRLHNLYDVALSDMFYNKSLQCENGFDTTGNVVAKDKNGNISFVSVDDDRYKSGELKHILYNKVHVIDDIGNIQTVDVTDQRYIDGDLKYILCNTVCVIDSTGRYFRVSVDDQRYIDGELKNMNCNKVTVINPDGSGYMKVDITDERYKSGELKHNMCGKTHAYDNEGNYHFIDVDDYRMKNGELRGIHAGKVLVRYNDTCILVSVDDERYKSGELKHINKGRSIYKDKNGEVISMYNTESNGLFGINKGLSIVYNTKTGKLIRLNMNDPRILNWECLYKNSCVINDVKYQSFKHASISLGMNVKTIESRCRNKNFKDWILIKNF